MRIALYSALSVALLVASVLVMRAFGMSTNQAVAFTLLGKCIFSLLVLTLRVALKDREQHDH